MWVSIPARLTNAPLEGTVKTLSHLTLTKHEGETLLERATDWATMPMAELKRRAMTAANERDAEQLWALTEAYLTVRGAKGTNISQYTLRNYRTGIEDLIGAWQHVNLLRPGRDDAQLWIRSLEAAFKPGTVRLRVAAARALYRALRWAAATELDPFLDAKPPRDPVNPWEKRQHYTVEHLNALLAIADDCDRVIVLLGSHAALRISEVADLTWGDVDLEGGSLTVRGKGGRRDLVQMSTRLAEALKRLPKGEDHEKVLPWKTDYTRERFQRLCRRAGVPYRGRAFHGLRHASGTRLLEVTGDLALVADHLRHANVETTRTYAKRQVTRTRAALELM